MAISTPRQVMQDKIREYAEKRNIRLDEAAKKVTLESIMPAWKKQAAAELKSGWIPDGKWISAVTADATAWFKAFLLNHPDLCERYRTQGRKLPI